MSRPTRFTKLTRRRPDRRRRALSLEWLEARDLLSFTARQVLDLNTSEIGTRPHAFTTVGDELFFLAPEDGYNGHGDQVWKYDGNAVTQLTRLVSDSVTTPPVALAGSVYFGGDIGDESAELWRYSAERGSEIAVDINPNDDNYEDGSYPENLTVFDGRLYFSAVTVEHGRELWSFDGSTARLAANINETPIAVPGYEADAGSQPTELTVHAGSLYFVANDGIHGPAIWRFDGQSATLAFDIDPSDPPAGLTLIGLTSFRDDLYFIKNSHAASGELWRYRDGSAVRVGAFPYTVWTDANSVAYEGHLYYTIPTTPFDWRRSNHEIWRTDGTQLERMADFPSVASLDLANYRDELYFIGYEDLTGSELWKYDGSRAVRATNINISGDSVYTGFAIYDDELHFAATDTGLENIEIWKFDGTLARRAADVRPGNASAYPGPMTTLDGELYFFAYAGNDQSGLFKLDGQRATLVSPTGIASPGGWGPFFAHTASAAYFLAYGSSSNLGLWQLAGGRATLISDTCGGRCLAAHYEGIVALGDEVLFAALDHEKKRSIWKFDGRQFTAFPDLPVNDLSDAKVLGNHLYVAGSIWPNQFAVLRYDGKDFEDVTDFFPYRPLLDSAVEFDGRIYFPAYAVATGVGLWSTDLALGGARLETERVPGNLTVFGGTLYFTGRTDEPRDFTTYLWRLVDGQTTRITENELNVEFAGFGSLAMVRDHLVFPAATSKSRGLWSYDGHDVSPIADFSKARFSYFGGMTLLGETLYFSADDFFYGSELWKLTIDRDADLDSDGVVGVADAVILQGNLGLQSAATRVQGDLDGDGDVTALDAAILAKQFGRRVEIAAASPVVISHDNTARLVSRRPRLAATRAVRPAPAAVDAALSATVTSFHSTRIARSVRVR